MKKYCRILLTSFLILSGIMQAQVGIGTSSPDNSSLLDLSSTTKGLLLPRMTTQQQTELQNPAIGLTVYNLTTNQLETNKGDGFGGKLWSASSGSGSGTGSAYTNVTGFESVNTNINSATVVSGMNSSPPAGTYAVSFNGQYNIDQGSVSSFITTPGAKSDLLVAYNQLNGLTENFIHGPNFGSLLGETLIPGVYYCASPATLSGKIILDAQGDPNAVFVIKLGAGLDVVADTKVILENGAEAWNVFWLADKAISIGQTCVVKGTFISHTAAISMQTGCALEGRMLSQAGAVNMVSSIIKIPLNTSTINLGVLSAFALFTNAGAVGNTGESKITGHVGTDEGAITGFNGAETTLDGIEFLRTTAPYPLDNNIFAVFSVYQNEVLIPNSFRTVITKVNKTDVIALQAIATVTAGQAIDIRWKTNLGVLSMSNRALTLIKLQ